MLVGVRTLWRHRTDRARCIGRVVSPCKGRMMLGHAGCCVFAARIRQSRGTDSVCCPAAEIPYRAVRLVGACELDATVCWSQQAPRFATQNNTEWNADVHLGAPVVAPADSGLRRRNADRVTAAISPIVTRPRSHSFSRRRNGGAQSSLSRAAKNEGTQITSVLRAPVQGRSRRLTRMSLSYKLEKDFGLSHVVARKHVGAQVCARSRSAVFAFDLRLTFTFVVTIGDLYIYIYIYLYLCVCVRVRECVRVRVCVCVCVCVCGCGCVALHHIARFAHG